MRDGVVANGAVFFGKLAGDSGEIGEVVRVAERALVRNKQALGAKDEGEELFAEGGRGFTEGPGGQKKGGVMPRQEALKGVQGGEAVDGGT